MRSIILNALLGLVILLSACSDDEETSKQQFSFKGKSVSLVGANLYVSNNTDVNNYTVRYYFLSDGVYAGGNHDSYESYTNATYVLWFTFGKSQGSEEFAPGSYPTISPGPPVGDLSQYATVMFESEDITFRTSKYNGNPVVVKGGMNVDETMTLTFSGDVMRIAADSEETETVSGRFHFKGTVQELP